MLLLEPLPMGPREARNRVVLGPHETNLGDGRALSERHVAYYRRRAAGGLGTVVVEEAAVHPSDWPYERSPLAAECAKGWQAAGDAVRAEGALVLAAIGHSGGQGTSAYSQAPLWAPSRVPETNSREVPKAMEEADIAAVIDGFAAGARLAREAGLDGVEVNAGQFSLLRQFLSGLTNHRDDDWGADKTLLTRRVLAAVRTALGPDLVVGLRLSCDELAPWAGITPDAAVALAPDLVADVDVLTVVRGSIYSASATRPDGHVPPGFNLELAAAVRAGLPVDAGTTVVAQGSIVDAAMAEAALAERRCDGVEMTRALLADAALVAKLIAGTPERVRPCILCNQTCQVRDARNPIVTCVADPRTGHELDDPPVDEPDLQTDEGMARDGGLDVLVVGGGVAGLECARVAAQGNHRVTVAERSPVLGGALRTAARGAGRGRLALLADWLEAECRRLDVKIETGRDVTAAEAAAHATRPDAAVVLCTGARPGARGYEVAGDAVVLTAAALLDGAAVPDGPVAVWDPIGGPIGVSVAERLRAEGRTVHLVTPDLIAGNELSRSGDLAPANVRLQGAGVVLERRSRLRRVDADGAVVEDPFTGGTRTVAAAVLVDAGHRLPGDELWRATGGGLPRAGDAVAPRTAHEAVLEGRLVALGLDALTVGIGGRP
jgi:2,4-dienoyl-CoA reductase (NADPH2)